MLGFVYTATSLNMFVPRILEKPVYTMCLKWGYFESLSSSPAYMWSSSGINFCRKVRRVLYDSPIWVPGEKNKPFALVDLSAWSSASWLSFSWKLTTVTPAFAAPIYRTKLSALDVWSINETILSPCSKPASTSPNASAELYLWSWISLGDYLHQIRHSTSWCFGCRSGLSLSLHGPRLLV